MHSFFTLPTGVVRSSKSWMLSLFFLIFIGTLTAQDEIVFVSGPLDVEAVDGQITLTVMYRSTAVRDITVQFEEDYGANRVLGSRTVTVANSGGTEQTLNVNFGIPAEWDIDCSGTGYRYHAFITANGTMGPILGSGSDGEKFFSGVTFTTIEITDFPPEILLGQPFDVDIQYNIPFNQDLNVKFETNTNNPTVYEEVTEPNNFGCATKSITLTVDSAPEGNFYRINARSNEPGVSSDVSAVSIRTNVAIVSALPVELVAFRAQPDDQTVQLSWTTAWELNNSHFLVQHGLNGTDFNTIRKISGMGTTESTTDYRTLHEEPASGVNYYRLVQVDLDGQETIYETLQVILREESGVALFPTATSDVVHLTGLDSEQVRRISILSPNGQVLEVLPGSLKNYNGPITVADYAPGTYRLSIVTTSNEVLNLPFVKL